MTMTSSLIEEIKENFYSGYCPQHEMWNYSGHLYYFTKESKQNRNLNFRFFKWSQFNKLKKTRCVDASKIKLEK
jgi:hypothetical protein